MYIAEGIDAHSGEGFGIERKYSTPEIALQQLIEWLGKYKGGFEGYIEVKDEYGNVVKKIDYSVDSPPFEGDFSPWEKEDVEILFGKDES